MTQLLGLYSSLLLMVAPVVLGQNNCARPPRKIDLSKCCDPPKWEESDTAKHCDESHNVFCYSECVLNATKVITDGQVNSDNVKSVFNVELKNEPDFIPIAIKAFETCFSLVKQKMGDKNIKIGGCSVLAAGVIECTTTQLFVNCPEKRWRTSPECEETKDYYQKCPVRNAPTVN